MKSVFSLSLMAFFLALIPYSVRAEEAPRTSLRESVSTLNEYLKDALNEMEGLRNIEELDSQRNQFNKIMGLLNEEQSVVIELQRRLRELRENPPTGDLAEIKRRFEASCRLGLTSIKIEIDLLLYQLSRQARDSALPEPLQQVYQTFRDLSARIIPLQVKLGCRPKDPTLNEIRRGYKSMVKYLEELDKGVNDFLASHQLTPGVEQLLKRFNLQVVERKLNQFKGQQRESLDSSAVTVAMRVQYNNSCKRELTQVHEEMIRIVERLEALAAATTDRNVRTHIRQAGVLLGQKSEQLLNLQTKLGCLLADEEENA